MLTFLWKGRKLTGSKVTTRTFYESIISQIKAESITITVGPEQLPNTLDLSRKIFSPFFSCVRMCVFSTRRATELSLLPYHGEFQSCGRDELVWNKLAVLTAQTAPALGYKLKQKQPYLHISASSPWNPIRSASVVNAQQTERLPSSPPPFTLSSQVAQRTLSIFIPCVLHG